MQGTPQGNQAAHITLMPLTSSIFHYILSSAQPTLPFPLDPASMSGLELAGVVLGAFPVVVQLMNGYKKGCQPLGAWLRFRKTFTKLENGISYQETALDTNLQILLSPLVEDEQKLVALVNDLKAGSGPQKYPDLEEALKRRLGNARIYLRCVQCSFPFSIEGRLFY